MAEPSSSRVDLGGWTIEGVIDSPKAALREIQRLQADLEHTRQIVGERGDDIWMNTYAAMRRARDAAQNELATLAATVNLQATEIERLRQIVGAQAEVIQVARDACVQLVGGVHKLRTALAALDAADRAP